MPKTPEFPEIHLAMIAKAMSGDAGGLYRMASELMETGVSFESVLFDHLLAIERSVGRRWAQGDYLVSEEHAVTATVETVIAMLAGMFDQPPDATRVVVTTAEGDSHSLPARALAAHLVYLGYRTTFLGANVPSDDIGEFLESDPPDVLVVSGAMTTHLLGARAVVEAAHEVGIPVVVGGNAFGIAGKWAHVVGADSYAPSLREVPPLVDSWSEGDRPTLTDPPAIPDSLSQLLTHRVAVVSKLDDLLGTADPRVNESAGLLLGSVEGALLTSDDQVIVDMLQWQQANLSAYGSDPERVVSSLAEALVGVSPDGASALDRARSQS